MVSKNFKRLGIATIAGAILVATPFIVQVEDSKLDSYQDIAGVWTVCSGETYGVEQNIKLTKEECAALTQSRIGVFMFDIIPHITQNLSADTLAAHTSFAYNIGIEGYKRSTTLRLTNKGDIVGGCRAMALWNKVDGKVSKGLVNRRNKEIALCVKGIK